MTFLQKLAEKGYIQERDIQEILDVSQKEGKSINTVLKERGVPSKVILDTKAEQTFSFEPLGKRKDGNELILKFEILEIYKGEKYSDTALTEIYFQGIDVY